MTVAFRRIFGLISALCFLSTPAFAWSHGAPCPNLVAVGDSITVGFGATQPFPATIATALSSIASNQGVNGIGWNYNPGGTTGGSSLINTAATNVDPLFAADSCVGIAQRPVLLLFAGTNDLFYGATPAQAYSSFQTYLSNRISFGWQVERIIVATILQRSGDTVADRDAFNALIVAGATTSGYGLVRLDLDVNIGCSSCNTNLTYFQADQVHPNNTGLQIIANLVCLQMRVNAARCPAY